jgi:hypothetical protein
MKASFQRKTLDSSPEKRLELPLPKMEEGVQATRFFIH